MRAIWSGSISFGLVNIPVSLYSASKERPLSFRLLAKDDLCPISYKKVCRNDNRAVEQKDIVKGYEFEKDQYVILEPDDFKRANARKTELIDIVQFATEKEINGKLYDKPYYVEPLKKSMKAYALLRDALKKSSRVGIAKLVMRDREHIAALRPEGDLLVLVQLRYADELRDPGEINAPAQIEYSKKELDLALHLIENLTEEFKVTDFKDTFAAELMKVIRSKAKGTLKRIPEEREEVKATEVSDILAMLKKSLDEQATVRS